MRTTVRKAVTGSLAVLATAAFSVGMASDAWAAKSSEWDRVHSITGKSSEWDRVRSTTLKSSEWDRVKSTTLKSSEWDRVSAKAKSSEWD